MVSVSRSQEVIIACCFLVVLATVGVVLRLYARVGITRNVGSDDAVLLLAWIIHILCAGFIIARKSIYSTFQRDNTEKKCFVETKFGLGRHFKTITEPELVKFLQVCYSASLTTKTDFVDALWQPVRI